MPTPVATARQCLTDDATRALDDAVSVAKRRSHSQTTSLHAVSALLALPFSTLRDACSRARPTSGYPPANFQLRALELCVGVSLDRLPSGKSNIDDDPPISNSLMAAIKRSQANQRRNPESFHVQQIAGQPMVVKVELKYYVLSILDDPIVSRVFGDAGYRSCDVKLGILHPLVSAGLRFSRSLRCPPLIFMLDSKYCGENGLGWRGAGYPFDAEAKFRRLGEVLVRKSGRNPLLIGACANDDLVSFTACLERRKPGILPGEINGLDVVSVAEFLVNFVGGKDGCEEKLRVKLKELEAAVESSAGPGVLVHVGDMKLLISENASGEAVSCLVNMMADLLRRFSSRLWLIGAMQDDGMYKQLVAKFPTLELDWDLHLVPLTSKPIGVGFDPKSSLMGSFVPFGGFFSNPSDYSPLRSTSQTTTRCQVCNEKYEQEVSTILKGGGNVSNNGQYSLSLPSRLETNLNRSMEGDLGQAQNEGTTFRDRILSLQKKWNETCQNLHNNHRSPKSAISCSNVQSVGAESLPIEERKQSSSRDSSVSQSSCPSAGRSMAASSKSDSLKDIVEISRDSGMMTGFLPETSAVVSTVYQLPLSFPRQEICFNADQVPAPSVIEVTTDLGLGTIYYCPKELHIQTFPGNECLPPTIISVSKELSTVGPKIRESLTKPFVHGSEPRSLVDMRDFKSLWQALIDRVSWQEEAIYKISQCISHCRTTIKCRSSNIWLNFTGYDKVCRRTIAAALAEVVTGSKLDLIYINLDSQDGTELSDSIFSRYEIKGQYLPNRGKTMADCIAGKLSSRPNSVVFLENLDKADLLIQSSLSRAIKTARFPDSHGREVILNNMIFILSTSSSASSRNFEDVSCASENVRFSEETILKAKCWKLQITTGHGAAEPSQCNYKNVMITQPELRIIRKRKCDNAHSLSPGSQKSSREFLDLNLPAEELEEELKNERSDSDTVSLSENWLEEFLTEVDEKVSLRPFNFDALADKVLHLISQSFQKEFGSGIKLQIDHKAFIQILAASWLSDRAEAIEDWVKSVLVKDFLKAQNKNSSSSVSIRLVPCEGMLMEDESPDICLPCSIIVN